MNKKKQKKTTLLYDNHQRKKERSLWIMNTGERPMSSSS